MPLMHYDLKSLISFANNDIRGDFVRQKRLLKTIHYNVGYKQKTIESETKRLKEFSNEIKGKHNEHNYRMENFT